MKCDGKMNENIKTDTCRYDNIFSSCTGHFYFFYFVLKDMRI